MIGKVFRNKSFRETTRYVLEKEKAKHLGGTLISTKTDAICQEFMLSRNLNPDIERPVYHLIQSYSYEDRDSHDLTNPKLAELSMKHFAGMVVLAHDPQLIKEDELSKYHHRVNQFLEDQRYEYQFFIAKHEDTDHIHTHMVASRINLLDSRVIPSSLDWIRSQSVCRDLEKEYGLSQVQSSWEVETRKLSPAQKKKAAATGTAYIKEQLQDAIHQAAQSAKSVSVDDFINTLNGQGIEVKLHPRGNQIGISYAMNGISMRASKLGQKYTYKGLKKYYGVNENTKKDIESSPKTIPTPPVVDPLLEVLQAQDEYAKGIAPAIQAISIRALSKDASLSTLELGSYQIRIEGDQQISLLKEGRLILEGKKGQWKGSGVSNEDIDAIEYFEQISKQQFQDQQAIQDHQSDTHGQIDETSFEPPDSYSRGMER